MNQHKGFGFWLVDWSKAERDFIMIHLLFYFGCLILEMCPRLLNFFQREGRYSLKGGL